MVLSSSYLHLHLEFTLFFIMGITNISYQARQAGEGAKRELRNEWTKKGIYSRQKNSTQNVDLLTTKLSKKSIR